jgi:hypothetical protein
VVPELAALWRQHEAEIRAAADAAEPWIMGWLAGMRLTTKKLRAGVS